MRYRLYGREGITDREFQKLLDWGVIKQKPSIHIKIKKKIKKDRVNPNGQLSEYSAEDSREVSSAYTHYSVADFENNE